MLAVALFVAGCFDSSAAPKRQEPTESDASRPMSTRTSRGGAAGSESEPERPGSNNTTILHFLAPPKMTLSAPTGSTDVAVPLEGPFLTTLQFVYTAKTRGQLEEGNITLWIRVSDPTPTWGLGCDISVTVRIGKPGQQQRSQYFDCPSSGIGAVPVMQPGVYELLFSRSAFGGSTNAILRGDQITVQIGTYAVSHSVRPTVFILTGSTAHDSRFEILGWGEAQSPSASSD